VLLALAFAAQGGGAHGSGAREQDKPGPPAQQRLVRVGVYQNPPKVFTDEHGAPSGILPGLLGEIARAEDWELEYLPCEWTGCLQALELGRIDLMPDVAWSREREAVYDFHHTPVLENWSQVYAGPSARITRLSELDGRRVAVLKSAIQLGAFTDMVTGFGYHVTVVEVESYDEGFRLASRGSVDAVVANHFVGDYLFPKYRLGKTPIVFQPASLFFAAAEGHNRDLLNAIDRHLDAWRREQNSPYYRTLARWMERPPSPVVPRRLVWGLGLTGGGLVAGVGLALLFQAQVRARTRHLSRALESLRAAEEKVRRTNEGLEQRVGERTAQLEAANRELEAFSYSVSHDLRAPLRVIDGYTKMLEEDHGSALDDGCRRVLAVVRDEARRMGQLIDDLLAFSRTGRQQMQMGRVDMSDMAAGVCEELRRSMPQRPIDVRVAPLPPAAGDPALLRQVWVNLLSNALKFTGKRERAVIEVRGEVKGDHAEYTVADNGVGFDVSAGRPKRRCGRARQNTGPYLRT